MKVHRVSFRTEQDGSRGFAFYTSKADAERKAQDVRIMAVEAKVETFHVELTKAGVLKALVKLASHPDNG